MLHKLNSIVSLVLSLLLLLHMFLTGSLMLGVLPFFPGITISSWVLMGAFILHAVLSVFLLFTNQLAAKRRRYVVLNRSVYLQRIAALVLVILLYTHFSAFVQYRLASVGAFFLQLLLVLAAGVHMGLSMPRALIGLGIIVKETTFKKAFVASILLSAIISAYAMVGFCVLAAGSEIF